MRHSLPQKLHDAEHHFVCEANFTRRKAHLTEKVRMQSIRTFSGGGGRIRTIEAKRSRFTVCPLWPLGNSPRYAVVSQRLGYYSTDLGFVKGEISKNFGKNEALLTQYEASFGHEAKRAGENSFFMMRSIASCAQHASCAARRASLKKA